MEFAKVLVTAAEEFYFSSSFGRLLPSSARAGIAALKFRPGFPHCCAGFAVSRRFGSAT